MSVPLKEVPFSTSVIDWSEIQELPRSISIDEPLKLVPGVKVDNQANGSRVHLSIRGQGILTERGIRGIKVLYDGIPINDPTGFAPDFYDIDFNAVDRIEILRGPAASLYGGSASGGILNIITQNSPATPLFGEASTSFGSNNFWKGFGEFGGDVNDVNYRISFSRMTGDGYRVHTHFWGDNVYGKVVYMPSKSILLTPIFGWTNVYHENPEGINLEAYRQDPKQANSDAVPFNEFLQTERLTNGMTGSIIINKSHEIQFNGYMKRTLFTEANNRTFNHRTILTSGSSLLYVFNYRRPDDFIRNNVTLGADVQWQTIDEHRNDNLHSVEGDTIRSKEQIKQRGLGLFLTEKIDMGKNWSASCGLRYDDIHNELNDLIKDPYDASGNANFAKLTGRIGATYSRLPELNLFANWAQGFLPPATEELAQNPDNFGGFNKHLIPATSSDFDLGIRGLLRSQLYIDITGFYLRTRNDFDRYRISDPLRNQETFYRNAGASRRLGLELYSRYSPVHSFELQLAYTYSNFKYTISDSIRVLMDDPGIIKYIKDGNWLPNSPQHQLVIDGEYSILAQLSVGITAETLSKTYIDGANLESEAAAGYTLVHARIIYSWLMGGVHCELSLQARNLGDKRYVAFTEPDPGGNSYQTGAGRELFGGVKIRL
jgi:iron complex outermembrane receptor protein